MCCIFTCCGWMIDLIQRVWVFAMSCVIASAVCCVLITSSMAGVALGYNYSLAEYIETKETNVSVYLKRGVFDDEVSSDMEWRRRGQNSLNPSINDGDFITAAPGAGPEQVPYRKSGRRLEDTIMESNDKNSFEGSLMKLTVKPPYISTTQTSFTPDEEMLKVHSSYAPGSLDELKGIQSLINRRKMNAARDSTVKSTVGYDASNLAHFPMDPRDDQQSRRMMNNMAKQPNYNQLEPGAGLGLVRNEFELPKINPERYAVPRDGVISEGNWVAPKLNPETFRRVFNEDGDPPPYPQPVTVKKRPIRPSLSTSIVPQLIHRTPALQRTFEPGVFTGGGMNMDKFKEEPYDNRLRNENIQRRPGGKQPAGSDTEYYDDEVKGIPVRKRRSINNAKVKQKPQGNVTINNEKRMKNHSDKDEALSQFSTLKPQAYLAFEIIPRMINLITKFKVGKTISDEITDYPSILVRKLHFSNYVETSSAVIRLSQMKISKKTTQNLLNKHNHTFHSKMQNPLSQKILLSI